MGLVVFCAFWTVPTIAGEQMIPRAVDIPNGIFAID